MLLRAFGSTSRSNPSYFWWAACPAEGMCVNAAFYGVAGAFATLVGVTRITRTLASPRRYSECRHPAASRGHLPALPPAPVVPIFFALLLQCRSR